MDIFDRVVKKFAIEVERVGHIDAIDWKQVDQDIKDLVHDYFYDLLPDRLSAEDLINDNRVKRHIHTLVQEIDSILPDIVE